MNDPACHQEGNEVDASGSSTLTSTSSTTSVTTTTSTTTTTSATAAAVSSILSISQCLKVICKVEKGLCLDNNRRNRKCGTTNYINYHARVNGGSYENTNNQGAPFTVKY